MIRHGWFLATWRYHGVIHTGLERVLTVYPSGTLPFRPGARCLIIPNPDRGERTGTEKTGIRRARTENLTPVRSD